MNRPNKRPIVYAIRDFPPGCGTHFNAPTSDESNLPESNNDSNRPEKCIKIPRKVVNDHNLIASPKAKGPSKQETEFTESQNSVCDGLVTRAPRKDEGTSSSRQLGEKRNSDPRPSSREKVREVLGIYKQVFEQLSRDKEARRGEYLFNATARIDLQAQAVLEKTGKLVNTEKRIGPVPGIEVGDEFQYKTELRVIGLHFKTMAGIDYMKIGEAKFATSIVASEGYGYEDKFASDVMVYTGEGGNVISKEKQSEDQKLLKGNLALANSMRHKRPVRVIRGKERLDRKGGKHYVYDGLYLVDKYWLERVQGKGVYKFKLCRIPGQRHLT